MVAKIGLPNASVPVWASTSELVFAVTCSSLMRMPPRSVWSLVEPVGALGLKIVGPAGPPAASPMPLKARSPNSVGVIIERAVFADRRDLEIEIPLGMQIRDRPELAALGLCSSSCAELNAEIGDAVDRADAAKRRLARVVRDLKLRIELAEHDADLVVRVDDLFEIGEVVALLCIVVDLVVFRCDAVDAMIALQVVAREEIIVAVDEPPYSRLGLSVP